MLPGFATQDRCLLFIPPMSFLRPLDQFLTRLFVLGKEVLHWFSPPSRKWVGATRLRFPLFKGPIAVTWAVSMVCNLCNSLACKLCCPHLQEMRIILGGPVIIFALPSIQTLNYKGFKETHIRLYTSCLVLQRI